MKKLFVLLFVFFYFSIGVKSQDGRSMYPIINKTKPLIEYIENELNMEIVRMEFDILSSSKTTLRTLSAGWTYSIVAFGDYRFKDIDVSVYYNDGGNWVLVEKDQDASEMAVVTITPKYTSDYFIEIKAYSFVQGYEIGHYGLIIAHE